MQFRLVPAFLVFLGSYFPLAVILALQDITEQSWEQEICRNWKNCVLPTSNHPFLSLSAVAITLLCLILTFKILSGLRYRYSIDIVEAKPIPGELISYSIPYIVAFMGVDYGTTGKVAGLTVFLLWLFLITYRAGQIIMNPMLLVMGWNLFEASVIINNKHQRVVRLLGRGSMSPGAYRCEKVQGSYICMEGETE